jgi:hypothetical protein
MANTPSADIRGEISDWAVNQESILFRENIFAYGAGL